MGRGEHQPRLFVVSEPADISPQRFRSVAFTPKQLVKMEYGFDMKRILFIELSSAYARKPARTLFDDLKH
jgi:hypothetical protein